jgi:hypothetical protein
LVISVERFSIPVRLNERGSWRQRGLTSKRKLLTLRFLFA